MKEKRAVTDYRTCYRDYTPMYPDGPMEWYNVGVLHDGSEEHISERMAREIEEHRMLKQCVEYLETYPRAKAD